MKVSDLISHLGSSYKYTYYLNDRIIDLDELINMYKELLYFEFEDRNVIRLYVNDD